MAMPQSPVTLTPEQIAGLQPGLPPAQQFARRLAQQGCRVLIPSLVDRSDTHSGLPGVRHVRHSQREVLWRAAYEMGRTIQGYEIQQVLAATGRVQGWVLWPTGNWNAADVFVTE
mgnify:CR=1 FL=1